MRGNRSRESEVREKQQRRENETRKWKQAGRRSRTASRAGTAQSKSARGMDVARLWAEIEEEFYPSKHARLAERVLYFHLLRRTRLAGERELKISVPQLAKDLYLSSTWTRIALRQLAQSGGVRIVHRDHSGHRLEVRLPREIKGCATRTVCEKKSALDEQCWVKGKANRQAIFEREGNQCFYCRKELRGRARALDHVVPMAHGGGDSYRNIVACCTLCNSTKKTSRAHDFVRKLHRQGLLSRRELYRRIEALRDLKRGKLKPDKRKAA